MDTSDSAPLADGLSAEAPAGLPLEIFINYRHEDIPFAASMLYQELKGRFGQENIFFDGGTLRPGMQFLEEIKSHLASPSGVFIALIGPRWLETMTAHRRRRDDDYVVREIDLALQNRWMIIPMLVNDASLPDPSELPPAIRTLRDCQVARLRQTSLDDDIKNLSTRLDEIHSGMNVGAAAQAEAIAPAEADVPLAAVTEPPDNTGPVKVPASDVFPADDKHYQALFDEGYNNKNLAVFLGAGVNTEDFERPFRTGASMLPDDTDLAKYLAVMARMKCEQWELAEVAQYARIVSGEPNVSKWVKQTLRGGSDPGPVHMYLAGLPRRLKELGLEKRYLMIVTPKFDVALERAFQKEKEPFDVAVYMAPKTEYAGRFVHLPWGSVDPQPVLTNHYHEFPIGDDEAELTRTVIVRINGAVDDIKAGYRWEKNFVITEDHYIDYLRGRPAEEVVPMQILAKLRQASCLFLGYSISDWRLRVFLHWIWQDENLGGATHWAVEHDPDDLEQKFWRRSGVSLYSSSLTDYVRGFDKFLEEKRYKLR